MLRAALFIIAQNWKQSRCLSTNNWINEVYYARRDPEKDPGIIFCRAGPL